MILPSFQDLPSWMQLEEVRPYYDHLASKKASLLLKRLMDIFLALLVLLLLSPLLLLTALLIKLESDGPIFYKQTRLTQFGRPFAILKFRTMVVDADKLGAAVTVDEDPRVTKLGHYLRRFRLDEFPQMLNVLKGDMSLVGTRPEVPRLVKRYQPEMLATLLLPAGSLSTASIEYKHESDLLQGKENPEQFYVDKILPEKMAYNLQDIRDFSLGHDLLILMKSLGAVLDL